MGEEAAVSVQTLLRDVFLAPTKVLGSITLMSPELGRTCDHYVLDPSLGSTQVGQGGGRAS